MTAFPWDEAMRFGFGVLKLHPNQFWAMTPRELASAMDAQPRPDKSAPSRADLHALLDAHPDHEAHIHG